jgi:ketosteroid isomerase-like protein
MGKADERIRLMQALLGALERLAFDEIGEMIAEDAIFDFPFRAGAQSTQGRRAIVDDLRVGMGGFLKEMKFEVEALHPCEDPELLAAEYRSRGVTVDGHPYANRYGAFLRVRDGRITLFREFFNPLATQEARQPDA